MAYGTRADGALCYYSKGGGLRDCLSARLPSKEQTGQLRKTEATLKRKDRRDEIGNVVDHFDVTMHLSSLAVFQVGFALSVPVNGLNFVCTTPFSRLTFFAFSFSPFEWAEIGKHPLSGTRRVLGNHYRYHGRFYEMKDFAIRSIREHASGRYGSSTGGYGG